ncbi:MAG: c-type cytochrome [Candidatus Omnitrophica bacterium]|nr:c-type cytochrome [Candidatus Omnitrophota bacterium]
MAKPSDKDSIYDTKKLSVIFGIISVILFGVIVWMVIDDHAREWKKYQRSFEKLQFAKAQEELKSASGKINAKEFDKLKADLAKMDKDLAAKNKNLAAKLKKQSELANRVGQVAQQLQVERSYLDTVRYAYETAATSDEEHLVQMKNSAEEKKNKLKKELSEWQNKVSKNQSRLDELAREKEQLDAEVLSFAKERGELEAKITAMTQDQKRTKKKLDALAPGFFNAFRNSAIFDFMAPTYKVHQLVMEDLFDDYNFVRVPKVDRCTTCHTAIDTKGFENAPQPFRTHPNLDLYLGSNSPHPIEKTGCTVCHGGNGQALTFYHTGHTPSSGKQAEEWEKKYRWHPLHDWDDPMLAMNNIQSSCVKCHQGVMEIPQAPKWNQGRKIVEQMGCWGCHKIHGIEGIRKVGPDLTNIRGKVDPAWVFKWIKEPKSFRPDTNMPQFFGLSNAESQQDEDAQVAAITAYLFANSGEFKSEDVKETGDPIKGKELIQKVGCMGCHSIGDIKVNNFAADLSTEGSKTSLAWLVDWLKNPKHYWPETHMPSLRLTDQEAIDIASFLTTQKSPTFDAIPEPEINKDVLNKLVREELRESNTDKEADEKLKAMNEDEKKTYLGERLITFYGCFACHNIKGFENSKEIGTELTEEGSKVISQFDFGFLHDIPHTRQAFFDQKLKNPREFDRGRVRTRKEKLHMPHFTTLTDDDRAALVTYLTSLKREYIPLNRKRLLDDDEKEWEAAYRIIRDHNCAGCHTYAEGEEGGNIAKTVEDPGMAPPSIVGQGKRTQDKWLFNFLKNPTPIRPWLHFRMPTFGFSDQDADTLVKGFRGKSHVPLTFVDADAKAAPESLADGKKIFEMFQCTKCHAVTPEGKIELKEGVTASDLAPNLTLAKNRLRHEWIVDWLKDPNAVMPNTRMPGYFPDLQSPAPDILGGDAMKQMAALRDYVVSLGDQPSAPAPATPQSPPPATTAS